MRRAISTLTILYFSIFLKRKPDNQQKYHKSNQTNRTMLESSTNAKNNYLKVTFHVLTQLSRPFCLGGSFSHLQITWYSQENCSFIPLKIFIHMHTTILKFKRTNSLEPESSHGLKRDNKTTSRERFIVTQPVVFFFLPYMHILMRKSKLLLIGVQVRIVSDQIKMNWTMVSAGITA